MTESVPVRCPACRRERLFTAPGYPCVCGTPVAPPLDPTVPPVPVTHRSWEDQWVTVRCPACDRRSQWPRPELGCACGAVLRIAVSGAARDTEAAESDWGPTEEAPGNGPRSEPPRQGAPEREPEPRAPENDREPRTPESEPEQGATRGERRRGVFRPVPVRTARDAVTVAALYLRWLGHDDVRRADQRPPSGIGLAARGMVAQVDPSARPASLRDVECLWLTAMTESAACAFFSLSGYTAGARAGADGLGVALFVLAPTGKVLPVNAPARALASGDPG
ncbi:hypothetical protein [Streptomyces griseosporeus]|uniref:hypothetical protein n=1 Tax=Streptomyces griseosporeus TaxID=1910 RepID=UPI00167F0B77|nr:hypothetical protein [Streptomyces griseosporeus]GHF46301.1 hypothetical protein GCM10018783_14330 [Streptomyces griseosporeus]